MTTHDPLATLDATRTAADQFAKNFCTQTYESGHAQNFVRGLCDVFGLNHLLAVKFEHRLTKSDGKGINRVDGFFAGLLLVEMKSEGKDLDDAYTQAAGYIDLLKDPAEKPRYILVSDFQNMHLYDLEHSENKLQFKTADFAQHFEVFEFLRGYETIHQRIHEQANIAAAEKLGALHDAIKKTGYTGEALQTLLVRILFCLFAEDTDLFTEEQPFTDLVIESNADGENLGGRLDRLFRYLDTNQTERAAGRQRTDGAYAYLLKFPYINGALFQKPITPVDFDADSRRALIDCCNNDWSNISPDIFGTLFQHIMHWDDEAASSNNGKTKKRRDFGAHYTSERNIRRAIEPLFLDALKDELAQALHEQSTGKKDDKKLKTLIAKLHTLNIFDPACGCGNFLVVAYREIRHLESQAISALTQRQLPQCDVHQFHGIEIDPTAVEIATVALWLTDHQMNRRFEDSYTRIPLNNKANIVCGNALQTDWNDVIKAKDCNYIVGNPPFIGSTYQSRDQKADMAQAFNGIKGAGVLDYVSAWYVKAWAQIQENPAIKAAFVSTNSITQGEQVAILWQPLFERGLHIHFAHRTFRWSNEGTGVAAVHCVIVGFGADKPKKCTIWDYSDNISANGKAIRTKRINAYLIDASAVFLQKRSKPLSNEIAEMVYGSKPTDGGNLLLSEAEAQHIRNTDTIAAKYIRDFLGAEEFINNLPRHCLWLTDCTKQDIENSPELKNRLAAVREMRLASTKIPTQKLANVPHLFGEIRQTDKPYLLIPRVSSEQRKFIPVGFLDGKTICSDANFTLPNATLYHFGMLTATMHNAWMRTTCGRLESRYRYSNTIVYNNYPWPQKITAAQKSEIETAAQGVLDARAAHAGQSLAWLYNPETMPRNLQAAHDELDTAVDDAYDYNDSDDDARRVAFLFDLYSKLASDESERAASSKIKSAKKSSKPSKPSKS